jgi:hypothetical protein
MKQKANSTCVKCQISTQVSDHVAILMRNFCENLEILKPFDKKAIDYLY